MSLPDKQKVSSLSKVLRFYDYTPTAMTVILFANETSATISNPKRVDNSFCCDWGLYCDCGAYF